MNYPSEIKIDDKSFFVTYKNTSALTSSIRLKKNNIEIKLSRFLIGKNRHITIDKFLTWATKKIKKLKNIIFIEPEYQDGGKICTHNNVYEIHVKYSDKKTSKAYLKNDGIIDIHLSNADNKTNKNNRLTYLIDKAIIKNQTPYLKEVIDELNQLHFQEKYNMCRFKRTRRFGSCSSKKNINIAYKLLFAPKEVFRYVCIHELAHLKEMNHSRYFWEHVKTAMPNYKESEKWLKNSGYFLP
jgi:predicted metal-dependent hydrolase